MRICILYLPKICIVYIHREQKRADLMRLKAAAARAFKVTLVFEQNHALAARLEVEEEATEEEEVVVVQEEEEEKGAEVLM